MKRASSSGRGSTQLSGALQPRDVDFTPNNRPSASGMGRKSYIPKSGQFGSGKGPRTRMGRTSTERLSRPSFAYKRLTPTRSNTPSSHPQSASRYSTGSSSSGIGASTRKDPRFINDPAYKTQCVNTILDFLKQNGYNNPFTRRTLLTPSTKDFTDIFTFIFQFLDPSYVLPSRFEEELPKLLKKLSCPVQLTKSSFVSVGSPHTWPAVLAALAFLIDIIHLDRLNSEATATMPNDLESDDIVTKRLECCISLMSCQNEDEVNACVEKYSEDLKACHGVTQKEMLALKRQVEEAEKELELIANIADEVEELQQYSQQYSDDYVKLNNYLQELDLAIQNKADLVNKAKQADEDLKRQETQLLQEIEDLEGLHAQQGYSDTDLIHLKYRTQETAGEIEHQEKLSKELRNQVWEKEVELGKAHSALKTSLVQYEALVKKLGLSTDELGFPADFSSLDVDGEEFNAYYSAVMDRIQEYKKQAKKTVTQSQNVLWEKNEELKRAKEMLQELTVEHKKLETKMRHITEEDEITREEMAREEQMRMEELESLHKKIIEARRRRKKPLRQLQDTMDAKKQELESCKKREVASIMEGHNFLTTIQEDLIRSDERKRKMVQEHTTQITSELNSLMEWLNSLADDEDEEANDN